jgi:isochorismate synthase EntC
VGEKLRARLSHFVERKLYCAPAGHEDCRRKTTLAVYLRSAFIQITLRHKSREQ